MIISDCMMCNVLDIDDCVYSGCSFQHSDCVDHLNGYTCDCDDGMTGTFCDISKNSHNTVRDCRLTHKLYRNRNICMCVLII